MESSSSGGLSQRTSSRANATPVSEPASEITPMSPAPQLRSWTDKEGGVDDLGPEEAGAGRLDGEESVEGDGEAAGQEEQQHQTALHRQPALQHLALLLASPRVAQQLVCSPQGSLATAETWAGETEG